MRIPPRDLLLKGRFVEDIETSLQSFALQTGAVPALVGFVERNTNTKGRSYFNSALCCEGKWEVVARKCLLPTYDVFDEARYFEPADSPGVIDLGGSRIGVTICEDIWNQPNVSGLHATHRILYNIYPDKISTYSLIYRRVRGMSARSLIDRASARPLTRVIALSHTVLPLAVTMS